MPNKRNGLLLYLLLLIVAFSFRFAVAHWLANDAPFDGVVYAQMARNLLEHGVYSHATEPPYEPSIIRLPGYPLFLAGIYSVFGHTNNTAVRIVQAALDTSSCMLIALVAFLWEPDEKLKRRSAAFALVLGAICPFTTIYVATILAETPTIFFAVAMCLTATLAFRAKKQKDVLLLWAATGFAAGAAVLFRPDSGLFAAALGITLVVTAVRKSDPGESEGMTIVSRPARALYLAAIFSLGFGLLLVPWTVRNFRVFHVFQPLAPVHAEMPGDFVPRGYLSWVRTWIDDSRYSAFVIWPLQESAIRIEDFPDQAFDSVDERDRVTALLRKYNQPQADLDQAFVPAEPDKGVETAGQADEGSERPEPSADEGTDESNAPDQSDESDQGDDTVTSDLDVAMTPELDAGFAQIARERIKRHPVRYYLLLPAKRAVTLWLDTHSQFYPFEGDLFPLADLDHVQRMWLPLFAALTGIYTILGIAGGWFLWRLREFEPRRWLLLAVLMVILRIGFFSTLENPEPRYVVEVFPFLSILGGIGLTRLLARSSKRINES